MEKTGIVHMNMARYADVARTLVRMTPGQTSKLAVLKDRRIADLTSVGFAIEAPENHFHEREALYRLELNVSAGAGKMSEVEFEATLSTEALPLILTEKFSLPAGQRTIEQSLFPGKFQRVKTWQGSDADCGPATWETVKGHQFTVFASRVSKGLELFLYKYAPALPNPDAPSEFIPLNLVPVK
jgi:hypothetical protein